MQNVRVLAKSTRLGEINIILRRRKTEIRNLIKSHFLEIDDEVWLRHPRHPAILFGMAQNGWSPVHLQPTRFIPTSIRNPTAAAPPVRPECSCDWPLDYSTDPWGPLTCVHLQLPP
jgi:hypothetical protein